MTAQTFFDRTLRCVALPVVQSDIGAPLEEMLSLWSDPRFAPLLNDATPRPHLMLVVNNAPEEVLDQARLIYDNHSELDQSFCGFTALSADLKGDMDRYERKPRARLGSLGGRAGPNFQFFRTMALAEQFGGFTLQIELDCLPVQAGWIEATQRVIDGHGSAWVIGSVYAGDGELTPDTQTHMNGNALYRTGDPLFQSFLAEVWLPRLLRRIKQDYTLPYDCWWAVERKAASALESNEAWQLFQNFDSFMQSDPFVTNLLCKQSDAQAYIEVFEKFSRLGQVPVFFHGAAMTALRKLLVTHPEETILDGMDRLTGQRGSRLRATDFAIKSKPLSPAGDASWLGRLPPGEALLKAVAAQLLTDPKHSIEGLTHCIELSRKALGAGSPTVAYFDHVTNFVRTHNAA